MGLSENALAVLARRYLRRDGDRVIETPDEMFERVARHVATRPDDAARYAERMASLDFLPNSPTLMNAGRPLGQLAACFVVPVADTTAAIFEAVGWAAQIQKTGGGTGFAFSRLRPAGDRVASTGGQASGPVAFMQVFDGATEAIKQGGTRRGANMGILRVDHPDILDFIAAKLDATKMRNFNLSVAATDAFMAAAAAGAPYDLVNPRTGEVVRQLEARAVLDLIANAAWAVGDPGLVFIDRINASQPTPALGAIEATNPCGEQPLLPFESCTLGSINLARFALPRVNGSRGAAVAAAPGAGVDWARLRGCVRDGVRFLDDVIDANRYPLAEIAAATLRTRKIGLGVMGLADLLAAIGVPYDDPTALALGGEIARFVEVESIAASQELARERGAFPAWDGSRWQAEGSAPLRNATTTTVAPTGTISIIAGCSSGIEPLYAVAYERHVLDGAVLREVHAGFRAEAEARGFWSDALAAAIAARGGVRGLAAVPADVQARYPSAHELPYPVHVAMQAAFQRHVHAAVSKTINLPAGATAADVIGAYRMAYELGCKGITVYRDGSREEQVLAFAPVEAVAPAAADPCPVCGQPVVVSQRCRLCRHCGWSACG